MTGEYNVMATSHWQMLRRFGWKHRRRLDHNTDRAPKVGATASMARPGGKIPVRKQIPWSEQWADARQPKSRF